MYSGEVYRAYYPAQSTSSYPGYTTVHHCLSVRPPGANRVATSGNNSPVKDSPIFYQESRGSGVTLPSLVSPLREESTGSKVA